MKDENGIISINVEQTKINSKENVELRNSFIDGVMISIKDNGKGIDPEIFPRLFSKFASKSFYGTRLGSSAKKIVEAHCGKIWANNNQDSESGATFSFVLPLATQQQSK